MEHRLFLLGTLLNAVTSHGAMLLRPQLISPALSRAYSLETAAPDGQFADPNLLKLKGPLFVFCTRICCDHMDLGPSALQLLGVSGSPAGLPAHADISLEGREPQPAHSGGAGQWRTYMYAS